MFLDGILVVEGKEDASYLSNYISSEIVVLNGYDIQEFTINYDAYKTSSNYLYKKQDGKLYWGPLWDFDLMLYMVDVDEPEQIKGFNQSLPFPWLDNLRSNDPEFIKLLKNCLI